MLIFEKPSEECLALSACSVVLSLASLLSLLLIQVYRGLQGPAKDKPPGKAAGGLGEWEAAAQILPVERDMMTDLAGAPDFIQEGWPGGQLLSHRPSLPLQGPRSHTPSSSCFLPRGILLTMGSCTDRPLESCGGRAGRVSKG